MPHLRFVVTALVAGDRTLQCRHADLVVSVDPSRPPDWELIAVTVGPPLDEGAHDLAMTTLEGRRLRGDALLVREVGGTHVLRGAGPLAGLTAAEAHPPGQ